MAVTILDALSPTYGSYPASFAVSAGANRWAFAFITHGNGADADPPTTITLGGQTPTLVTSADGASWDVTCTLVLWNETAIAAMSGSALTISGGSFFTGANAVILGSVQGASQSTPTPATEAVNGTSGAVSLTRVAGGYTVGAMAHDIQNTYSSASNPSITGQSDFNATNTTMYAAEASTAETVAWSWSNAFARDNAAVIVNFAPAPSGPTFTALTDPISDSISFTVSESVTATHARITVGSVVETIALDSPGTGTDFGIASLVRTAVPQIASGATIELLNSGTPVVSGTADLEPESGTFAAVVASPNTSSLTNIYHPNWASSTPLDGDQHQWTTPDSVVIAANGDVTGEGEFTVRHWDQAGAYGGYASYVISNGTITKLMRPGVRDELTPSNMRQVML